MQRRNRGKDSYLVSLSCEAHIGTVINQTRGLVLNQLQHYGAK